MTKTLSQQLCELVGIEAETIGCTNEYYKFKNECEGDCIDCTHYDDDEVYPDFEKPSNFVKLLNLVYKSEQNNSVYDFQLATLAGVQDDYTIFEEKTFEKTWIECLLRCLRSNKDSWDKSFALFLKTAIKQAEWEL